MANLFKIILFVSISINILSSQVISVLDSKNYFPLEGVNVFAKNFGMTTDSNGTFNLSNFSKNDFIILSIIGYDPIRISASNIKNIVYMVSVMVPMDFIAVYGEKNKKSRKKYARLERDVRRVYPYALIINSLMKNYDGLADSLISYSLFKRYIEKRRVFKEIETELISKYGYRFKKLTKNQGRILVRLINRETSKTSFNIIKEFRSIYSASFWQFTARIFGHNLKSSYDPQQGEDKMIEYILRRINKR